MNRALHRMKRPLTAWAWGIGWCALAPAAAWGQETGSASAAGEASVQRIEVTVGRDTAQAAVREQSTAAKTVIGQEEITRYGDANLGDVLKRLPGVTLGSGGGPRLRGLGQGFTQILLDGQRLPLGFSLESMSPEMVERIEILRAPTAETGAQAIAGTINIISREGARRTPTELKLGVSSQHGAASSQLNASRQFQDGPLTAQVTVAVFDNRRASETITHIEEVTSGVPTQVLDETSQASSRGLGLHLMSRLNWRLGTGAQAESLVLTPNWFQVSTRRQEDSTLVAPLGTAAYASSSAQGDSDFQSGRMGLTWRRRVGEWRGELNGEGALWGWDRTALRQERDGGSSLLKTVDDEGRTNEQSLSLKLKASRSLDPEIVGGPGQHQLVVGSEWEWRDRDERRSLLSNGTALLTEFGDHLQANSQRLAVFAQDEWAINRQWALNGGVRWEGIRTVGESEGGQRPSNLSSVWTPLFHAVWKPNPERREQWRLSLTRSYRAAPLTSLIARPTLSEQVNSPTDPDRAGNPDLKPELARGIDLGWERFFEDGGVLSANLFARHISQTLRRQTSLQTVSWASQPRWVSRTENVGDSLTQGLELEAKFRLDQVWSDAPKLDLRSQLSFFASRVESIPGPDNRLEGQPRATLNLGADYRLTSLPVQIGGSLNWVPATDIRLSASQWVQPATQRVWDAYAAWTMAPGRVLRLSASNLLPLDGVSRALLETGAVKASTLTRQIAATQWQLRLELKI